jgi:type III secretion protein J
MSTSVRIAVLAACLAMAGCGRAVLYANLSEQQANEVESVLLAAHLDADKSLAENKKGWSVTVAKNDFPSAMRLLKSSGLPAEPFESMGEVFKKEGFVSSPTEERARYLFAMSQELSHTLEQIDGVVAARVHIALPENDPLSEGKKSASASVVIIEQPGAKLRERETDIKAIVTDGVEGLDDINKVTVKFFTRAPSSGDAAEKQPAAQVISHQDDGVATIAAIAAVPASLVVALGAWFGRRRTQAKATPW